VTIYEEYIEFLRTTKWYAHADHKDSGELAYMSLGLAGEGGEFVDLVKKICRDHGYNMPMSDLSPDLWTDMQHELGDVLWYLTQLCDMLGLTLDGLMTKNMEKLKAREANDGAGRQHVR
jgi:NTP pyrophosphatase (non-canonical NTP hydrolase)